MMDWLQNLDALEVFALIVVLAIGLPLFIIMTIFAWNVLFSVLKHGVVL